MEKYEHLPYRKNVSMITFQENKFLLVNLKNRNNSWKFPQGGIEEDEDIEEAGIREFIEELGTDKIKIHGKSMHTNRYDWPVSTIIRSNERWKGQHQNFLVVEFIGNKKDIKINLDELKDYRWVDVEQIHDFSKDEEHMMFRHYNKVIPKILDEFSHIFKKLKNIQQSKK